MGYPFPITPGEFSSMWEVIAKMRKAKGDLAGSQRAKQAAYTMRLGRAVIHDDRAARVAAVNRVKPPTGVATPTREVRAMAKTTAAAKEATLTLVFEYERETVNKYRYREVDNGQGTILDVIYVPKFVARLFGLSALPKGFTVTVTPSE